MRFPDSCRNVRHSALAAGALASVLLAGCAKYKAQPLPLENYSQVLLSRTPSAAGVTESTPLTLPEAERVALYFNPRLRAARQEANIPAVDARYAGLWNDPVVSGDVLRTLSQSKNHWVGQGSLLFSIPISGRLHVQKEQARAEAYAAYVKAWGEEQQVIRELREAWTDWSSARDGVNVSAAERTRYENAYRDADRLVAERRFAPTEASLLRFSQGRVGLEEVRMRDMENQARVRVIALMGLTTAAAVELLPTETIPPWVGNAEDLYRTNPLILLRKAEYAVAEQTLRLEIREQFPDIQIGPSYEQRGGKDSLGLGVSFPLPFLNGNRGEIASARASRDAARVNWEAAVEQGLNEFALARSAHDLAVRRTDGLRVLVPSAESQVRDTQTRFETDDRNTFLLVDSVSGERTTKLSLIDAETAVARENAALWALIPAEAPNAGPPPRM